MAETFDFNGDNKGDILWRNTNAGLSVQTVGSSVPMAASISLAIATVLLLPIMPALRGDTQL